MLVASQQLQAPSTQHDPSTQYRKLPVEDPTMWIHEFQKEALETIGWLATTHNQTEFKKFGDGFRFKMMRRSDKIKNGLNAACPVRLWRNMPMEEHQLFVVDCDHTSERSALCAAAMVDEGYNAMGEINEKYLEPCYPKDNYKITAEKLFRGLMEVLCRLSVNGELPGYRCMYTTLTISDLRDIINKNYMDSVLQVTANDELLMKQSPARSSIEKKRRRMEFRSTKRAFKIEAKTKMPKSSRLGV